MPLSEHEQRVLEEIERSLLEEDPKFASAVRSADPRHYALRRTIWAGALFLLGVSVLVLGLVSQITPGGVPVVALLGFAIMFFAAMLAIRAYRGVSRSGEASTGKADDGRAGKRDKRAGGRAGPRSSFMDRLEERWKRRRGEGF